MNLASNTQIGSILSHFNAIASVLFLILLEICYHAKQDNIESMFEVKS